MSFFDVVNIMYPQERFNILKGLLINPNHDIKYQTIRSLSGVAEAMPSLAAEVLKELVELLKSSNDYVKEAVARSLPGVIKAMPSLTAEAYRELVELLKSSNDDVKSAAVKSLPEVVKVMPSLAVEAFKELVELLKSSKNYVQYTAVRSLTEVVKAMPAEEAYKELVELLKSSNDSVSSLTEVVKAISFNSTSYKQINELLKIINLTKTKGFYNDLYIAIKTTMKKITDYIGQEYEKNKDSKIIEWFNKCFDELPKISETQIFLKEICKTILKGRTINNLESNFILNCIQKYGFTFIVSINKEQRTNIDKIIEGKITFEDKSYEIFKKDIGQNHNGIVSLEEFAKLLLEQTNDPLAEQYKNNKPLFKNSETVLKIAACDLKSDSIVNNVELHNDKWQLSLMHLSNHKKKIPSKIFILLEKKSEFGEHVICKVFMEESKLKTINYSLHPQNIDTETCKQIFGEMEYTDSKPRYYGSTFEINQEAGEQLKKIAKNQDIIGKTEYEILRDILASIIDSEELNYTWEDYIKQKDIKEFKKAELLKIENRIDSWIIDVEYLKQSVKILTEKASGQHTEIIKSLTEKVAHLSEKDTSYQARFSEIMEDIENLENSLNNQQADLAGVTPEHT